MISLAIKITNKICKEQVKKMKLNTKKILELIHNSSFSGVVSVRNNEETILEMEKGYRDRVNHLPNEIDTRFGIASGTKLFTALGIMKLVEEEKISLDDKAFQYVPHSFPTYDQSVTIKHLLTHTSGLPDYLDDEATEINLSVPWYELEKPKDYLEILPQTPMRFTPGERFEYNDSGFILLAVIIEEITGDYHRYIEENILEKAKMTSSGFYRMNELPENTALGYLEEEISNVRTNVYALPIIGGGDGGMFSSVEDMHRFWHAFANGDIVSKQTVELMLQPHAKGNELFYGLGVWLKETSGQYYPIIIGQDPGVSFESGYDIIHSHTFVIISNTEYGVWPIARQIEMELDFLK